MYILGLIQASLEDVLSGGKGRINKMHPSELRNLGQANPINKEKGVFFKWLPLGSRFPRICRFSEIRKKILTQF
jgi:hypothetical protein